MKPLKVLLSAYACEPGKGSEPRVGWNVLHEVAKIHDVWVLTRANNRGPIEAELARTPLPRARFVYYDLPAWARRWKRGELRVQLYYYLWQVGAYFEARRLHRQINFDLIHHVTFGKYWAPSFLVGLPVPFVWGPVGGGERWPPAFRGQLSLRGRAYEVLREAGKWLGEHDPFVRRTARRSAVALVSTEETAERLRRLGTKHICVFSPAGLQEADIRRLALYPRPNHGAVRFVSVGRLLDWKGFSFGLRAFARADLNGAEYWIIGDGPERRSLEASARRLGIANRVRFWGWLGREETLRKLGEGQVLVHPSLHDAAPVVCIEAMGAGLPVICLDLGGPATQVTEETGLKVPAHDPEQVVRDLAAAMEHLAHDPAQRQALGEAGRQWRVDAFRWERKGALLHDLYADVTGHVRG